VKAESFEGHAGHGDTHTYRTDAKHYGDPLYQISVTTYPKNLDVKVSLDNMKNKLAENGKIVNDHSIELQGYPGVEFDLEKEKFHERMRYYVVKRRVVGLVVIVDAGEPFPNEMNRFFQSVQLTDAAK